MSLGLVDGVVCDVCARARAARARVRVCVCDVACVSIEDLNSHRI